MRVERFQDNGPPSRAQHSVDFLRSNREIRVNENGLGGDAMEGPGAKGQVFRRADNNINAVGGAGAQKGPPGGQGPSQADVEQHHVCPASREGQSSHPKPPSEFKYAAADQGLHPPHSPPLFRRIPMREFPAQRRGLPAGF